MSKFVCNDSNAIMFSKFHFFDYLYIVYISPSNISQPTENFYIIIALTMCFCIIFIHWNPWCPFTAIVQIFNTYPAFKFITNMSIYYSLNCNLNKYRVIPKSQFLPTHNFGVCSPFLVTVISVAWKIFHCPQCPSVLFQCSYPPWLGP